MGNLLLRVAHMPVINFGRPGAAERLRGWREKTTSCAVELVFTVGCAERTGPSAEGRRQNVRIRTNVLRPHLAGGLFDGPAPPPQPTKVMGRGWIVASVLFKRIARAKCRPAFAGAGVAAGGIFPGLPDY